jgi:hypothetical protein
LHDNLSESDVKVNSFMSYFFIAGMCSVISCTKKKEIENKNSYHMNLVETFPVIMTDSHPSDFVFLCPGFSCATFHSSFLIFTQTTFMFLNKT